MQLYEITEHFINMVDDANPDLHLNRELPDGVGYGINADAIPVLATELQSLIAEVIASLINAGSERDAVMENEALANAITEELKGWSA